MELFLSKLNNEDRKEHIKLRGSSHAECVVMVTLIPKLQLGQPLGRHRVGGPHGETERVPQL